MCRPVLDTELQTEQWEGASVLQRSPIERRVGVECGALLVP